MILPNAGPNPLHQQWRYEYVWFRKWYQHSPEQAVAELQRIYPQYSLEEIAVIVVPQ